MKMFLRYIFILSSLFFLIEHAAFSQVLGTYYCTGAVQNYVVPQGICQVRIKAWGAGGGGGGIDSYGGGAGGGGAYADVVINVTAGDVLAVYVGCRGLPGTGCATNPGGAGGWGYGSGGNGGNAGPIPCSGSGGGGGGSSGVMHNATLAIVASGGAGGGGGGCLSAGGDGGAGGMNGSGTSCAGGSTAASNGNLNGQAGQTHPADGGGGGGGGGGAFNGGQGGIAPPSGPSCNAANDCGAGGGAGGDSYAPAGTITNGAGTIPGNSGDPDLCAGCAQGGVSQASGTDGFVEIIAMFPQVVALASGNGPLCQGVTLNLTASGGTSYSWAGPNSFTSTSQNPSIPNATPAASGTYTALVTDANGCTAVDTATVIVNALPIANAGADLSICVGDVASLNASGGTNYVWSPSTSLSNANISNPTANPASSISYTVVVTDVNNCVNADSMSITVNPLPVAAAGSDVSVCAGSSTPLSATGASNYLWSPASGLSNPAISNPVATPTATTSYTVTVTDANNCSATDDVLVTVNPQPTAAFTVTTVCFNNPTLFTDMSSGGNIVSWQWNFGDGNIDSVQNPSHTYNNAATFVATLVVTTAEGCADSFGLVVTVNPLPLVSFSSTTVCVGNSTCFGDQTTIASGSITAWSWNFGDPSTGPNNISNSQNPCHTFSDTGSFSVVLTVTSNYGCQSTTINPALVMPPPVAAFSAPNGCLNASTLFNDMSSSATGWYWQFGDGGTSTSQNPSHTYLGYGTYVVTLIVSSSASCADTAIDTVTINPLPIVNFISDTVCQGDSTSFLDLSFIPAGSITGWHWDFGDGNSSSVQNPVYAYATGGTYNVTLTCTSNNGCASSLFLSVLVHSLPVADFSFTPSPMVQLIDPVDFNDLSTGGVVSWAWDFGDGDTSSVQYPSHYYSDTGAYVVTLIVVSNFGCVDTVQYPLEVQDFAFYIPNTFTPNGDDKNDFFFGMGIGIIEYEMSIFDRWGNLIFFCKTTDLPQMLPCLWDGKVKGGNLERVQEDVYVYKVVFTSIFKQQFTYIGNVNVVR